MLPNELDFMHQPEHMHSLAQFGDHERTEMQEEHTGELGAPLGELIKLLLI